MSLTAQTDAAATLASLTAPRAPAFAALKDFLQAQVSVFPPEVQPLVVHTIGHSGKMLRPLLVFLAGGVEDEAPPELIRAAAIVELVHLATLVHDDVLDQADTRHGTATLNARYGADTTVLLGDALFAHALKLAADFPTVEVCRWVAEATRIVCAGEIEQTFARGRTDFGVADYWRMVDGKTGELFAVSARLGAFLTGRGPDAAEAAHRFARTLGAGYQLYDDAVDLLETTEKAGKTLGTDVAGGKMTLPLLMLRETLAADAWSRIAAQLSEGVLSLEAIRTQLEVNAIWPRVAQEFADRLAQARLELAPFAPAPWTTSLAQLADTLTSRAENLLFLRNKTNV